MSRLNGKHLNPAAVERAQLLGAQKKHINSLNRLIWILIKKAGGEVRVPQEEMNTAVGWHFTIEPDKSNPNEIVFKATIEPVDKATS